MYIRYIAQLNHQNTSLVYSDLFHANVNVRHATERDYRTLIAVKYGVLFVP